MPGVGKSFSTLYLAMWALDNKKETKAKRVIYMDADNSKSTIIDKGIKI